MLSETEREKRSPITMPGYRKGERPLNYGQTYPPEVLTEDEIYALLRYVACCRGGAGARNYALVVLMWRTGLRIGETVQLYPKDIDRGRGTITVLRGKYSKRRQVGLDRYTILALEKWETVRNALGFDDIHPLFCVVDGRTFGTEGRPLSPMYVRDMLKRCARQAGITKRVHPHGLRHTLAFDLMMEGQPLVVIRQQLGHAHLSTTLRYTDHLGAPMAIKAIHARPQPSMPLPSRAGRAA